MNPHTPENLFRQMAAPDFYPHPADAVDIRETHISMVFLAGEFVYKIKKPLDLGFLDFTTLEKRLYFCRQELALNRRLARHVYLDVVPITLSNGVYHLAGDGPAVEYAVKMQRLSDDWAMSNLLEQGGIHQQHIHALSDVLARFYAGPGAPEQAAQFGSWEVVSANCAENFSHTAGFAGKLFDDRLFKIVRSAMTAFLQRRKPLFEKRLRSAKIKDCHGDLRTDHVYFTDNGVQIIDCIEFNPNFRYGDIASDLAFLVMDLDGRGHGGAGHALLTDYVGRTGDADLFALIDFYKCYRALVRFKVDCIRIMEKDVSAPEKARLLSEIEKYLNLAYGYAVGFSRPVLWVVCGMPASGKSAIAERLGQAFGIRVLQSDMIRKTCFASESENLSHLGFESGIYSRGATALTYGRMFLAAQEEIEKGNSVVLDATFGSRHFRVDALQLSADMDANIFFVECAASDDVLKKRLMERETRPSLSDARLAHFDAFKKGFEPLDEIRAEQKMTVNTEKPINECMARILLNEYTAPPKGSHP
jgi:uncharacterized protein